jgi:hypothetical protein
MANVLATLPTGNILIEKAIYSAVKFKALVVVTVLISSVSGVVAQKQTAHEQQTWIAYQNQTRLSNKFGLWGDFHLRTKEDFVNDLSLGIIRLGLTYYAHDQLKFTAGYAFVNHFPADNHSGISQPEHRPWQQVQWHNNSKRSRLMQYLRLEERYRRKILSDDELAAGYTFNWRVRYNLMLLLPMSQKAFQPGTLSLALSDEVHVNMGKQIVNNYFDQNRLFTGFAYHLNAHDQLQFGYMNVFQQLPAGDRYRSLHVARIFYFQNLDFRKNRTK